MKKSFYKRLAIGVLLPVFIFGALQISEELGSITGSGVTKGGEVFPVVVKSFTLDISEPVAGVREITFTIPTKNITTEKWMRDVHMRMSVFKKSHPNVLFSAKTGAELVPGHVNLEGELTINSVSKPISVNLDLKDINGSLVAEGSLEVSLKEFGIKRPGMGPMKVLDTISMKFNISIPSKKDITTL
ncbi:MAG: YceI family protein [Candidatus Marinimicrobia bacterium]|nr:YceI family protein [Candidatus Neomarinimicrobiota bacterium]